MDKMKNFANVWANMRYEEHGNVYYVFSEKALEAFSSKVVDSCVAGFGETRIEPSLTKFLYNRLGIKNVE
jgi:hypothetical protein